MSKDKDDSRRPIVIKRKKRAAKHGSHGAWKIAYADFMTAMMAFFLVMWLLGGLSDQQIDKVSEYFRTPLAAAIAGGDKSTASNSVIPGGGDDPIHSDGEVALTHPRAAYYTPDRSRFRELKQRLENMVHSTPELDKLSSQLRIDIVPDGLRIQILDNRNRPMFSIGSARIQPYVQRLLAAIAPILNGMDNKITLTGHTDDLRFAGGRDSYGNWELSTDRANAARRSLVAAGLDEGKLLRVIGAAATQRIAAGDTDAPANRRISILVLNAQAQHRIENPDGAAPTWPAPQRSDDELSAQNEDPAMRNAPADRWAPELPNIDSGAGPMASSVSLIEPASASPALVPSGLRINPQ